MKNQKIKELTRTLKDLLQSKVGLLILLAMILTGCSSKVVVYGETSNVESQPILEFSPEYGYAPVWLTENELFLPHAGDGPNFQGGAIYNLETDKLQALRPELGSDCFRGEFHDWYRLSNGKLGFLIECRDENTFLVGDYLVTWDSQTDQYEILIKYDRDSFPGGSEEFAVTNELDKVIQETTGGGIMHRLYRVSLQEDEISQLFPNFYRAGSPSWSPDGQLLAFAGNESGPRLLENIFGGYLNLRNEIYYPWNLYVVDGNGENLQEVLSGIRFADTVKWSPHNRQLIAFRGEYEDKLGLWLFDLDTESLTFLWPEGERRKLRFDWSPDGTKLVLLDCQASRNDKHSVSCRPIIVKTPLGRAAQ